MRRIISAIAVLSLFCSFSAYAAENPTLVEYRSKIFDESRALKLVLTSVKKDLIFMNSMCDSSIATLMQLDAYFSLVGIYSTIKKEAVTDTAVNYLSEWLNTIKSTNTANIKNLEMISLKSVASETKLRTGRLIKYYAGLNKRIEAELAGVAALKATAKKDKRR